MRIKRGVTKKQKHKKVLESTKGFRLSYSKLYRRAKEALKHSGNYNFMHRKHRHGQMREQWIKTISAGLTMSGVSYNKFINGLKKAGIILDRKVLADIATDQPEHFAKIVEAVKA